MRPIVVTAASQEPLFGGMCRRVLRTRGECVQRALPRAWEVPRREHAFTRGARTSTARVDTDTRVTIIEKKRAPFRLLYRVRTTNRVPLAAADRGYVSSRWGAFCAWPAAWRIIYRAFCSSQTGYARASRGSKVVAGRVRYRCTTWAMNNRLSKCKNHYLPMRDPRATRRFV